MTDRSGDDLQYVAPSEAPPPRRPPSSQIGIMGWGRENLWGSWTDKIITFVVAVLIILFLDSFLTWAFLEAQWEIVFSNLRVLGVGLEFPPGEVWRGELVAGILVFLSFFSIGIWGRLRRSMMALILLLTVAIFLIPIITEPVEEPTVHIYSDSTYNIRQVSFVGYEGQEYTFTIDPMTTPEDFLITTISGYVENDNQQANTSFDAFAEAGTEVTFTQTRDPSEFDLVLQVQVWDNTGNPIVDGEIADGENVFVDEEGNSISSYSPWSDGSENSLVWKWIAPYDGWFTYTMARDDDASTVGAAWLKVDNMDVFRGTLPAQRERLEKYGPQPELDCDGCATAVVRTDMRFQGTRTLLQWFSLQLSPFLLEIQNFYLMALFAAIAGYVVAKLFLFVDMEQYKLVESIENSALGIAVVFFIGYIGVQIASSLNPQAAWPQIRMGVLVSFLLALFIYAMMQLLRSSGKSRGVMLLWLLSIPLMMAIITGFNAPSPEVSGIQETPLPAIESENLGGLLLTLLLSAVAIIFSFPIGMLLALGRQSDLPLVSALSTIFIEVVRGVPLITLLFMGRLILPFFGFGLGDVDLLIRISVVLTLFTSAYMAEVIRGGLQIVSKGQTEAAQALGLNNFWTTTLITLPQALRAVIPAMMGQAVSLFKDTSLVYIVSLFEIVGAMNQILGDSQTGYSAFPREGYLYIGMVFFVFSYIMAEISRRIERTGAGAVRRDTM